MAIQEQKRALQFITRHLHICSIHQTRTHIRYSGVTLLTQYIKSTLEVNRKVLIAIEQNTSIAPTINNINW